VTDDHNVGGEVVIDDHHVDDHRDIGCDPDAVKVVTEDHASTSSSTSKRKKILARARVIRATGESVLQPNDQGASPEGEGAFLSLKAKNQGLDTDDLFAKLADKSLDPTETAALLAEIQARAVARRRAEA
jgi:hypothetical protein